MLTAYTDGSVCRLDNWRAGGWSVVVVLDGVVIQEISGTVLGDDFLDSEWIAILKAIEILGEKSVHIVSDSSGSVRRAEKMFPNLSVEWQRRGASTFNSRADELSRIASRPFPVPENQQRRNQKIII